MGKTLELSVKMNVLVQAIDKLLNDGKQGEDRKVGFCLLMVPFSEPDNSRRMSFVSNGRRKLMLTALEEFIKQAKRNT